MGTFGPRAISDHRLREFPKTLAALELVDDARSAALSEDMLDGPVASRTKIERVRQLLPAAMLGIQMQAERSSVTDADAALEASPKRSPPTWRRDGVT